MRKKERLEAKMREQLVKMGVDSAIKGENSAEKGENSEQKEEKNKRFECVY